MRSIMRRVELLEARQCAKAGVPEWLAGYHPESPEAQAWIDSHYDLDAWYESMTEAEQSTLVEVGGISPAAMSADDLETMANLTGRLQAFRRIRSPVR